MATRRHSVHDGIDHVAKIIGELTGEDGEFTFSRIVITTDDGGT
jgi:hypothetical protein